MSGKRANVVTKMKRKQREKGLPFIWVVNSHSQVKVGGEPSGFWECMVDAMAKDAWVLVACV